MSQSINVFEKTFVAGVDFTSEQFRLVKMCSSTTPMGVELADLTTDRVIGIIQNNPKEGQPAVVRILGTSKMYSGTPVAIGDLVGVSTPSTIMGSGGLVYTDKDISIGISLETSSSPTSIIEVTLTGAVKASI